MSSKHQEGLSRSKAGCTTCRSRKKKCDEVKPRCAGCRRNQLTCEWPSWVPEMGDGLADESPATLTERHHSPTASNNVALPVKVPPPISVLHAGFERPCAQTPQSVVLLQHYLRESAGCFAMTPLNENPFVTILLPLGYVDDLLMHALLALSGTHLTYQKADNIELLNATALHYSRLVSGLRAEFASLREDDVEKKERLLRVLIVACHYEDGRHVVHQGTLGLSMELYTYLVSCNTLTPYGLAADRTLPMDTFATSMEGIKSSPTFGVLFAGGHELYQLVPVVSLLASQRLAEEVAGSAEPSAALRAKHDDIHARLTSWTMPFASGHDEPNDDGKLRRHAAEALRQALYIYLATALAGATVTDSEVREGVAWHVRALFAATTGLIGARRYIATILWPVLIAGSCIVTPTGQRELLSGLCGGWLRMRQLEVLGKLLSLLWDDPDPRAYGPYGLYLIIKKHRLNVANA